MMVRQPEGDEEEEEEEEEVSRMGILCGNCWELLLILLRDGGAAGGGGGGGGGGGRGAAAEAWRQACQWEGPWGAIQWQAT
jgi:hypothetical protein